MITTSPFPSFIHLEPIRICNASCIICPSKGSGQKASLSLEKVYSLIDECADHPIQEFHPFAYNEPLITPHIKEIIAYANKKLNCQIVIFTNGQAMTIDMAKFLLDNGLKQICFSIDAFSKETHAKTRPGLDYDKVIQNIHAFLNENNRIGHPCMTRVSCVRTVYNEKEIPDFEAYWKKWIDWVGWFPCDGRARELGESANRDDSHDHACGALFSHLNILCTGDVTMCCQDWKPEISIGNVHNNSITDIWNSEAFNKLREIHNNKQKRQLLTICRDCKARY